VNNDPFKFEGQDETATRPLTAAEVAQDTTQRAEFVAKQAAKAAAETAKEAAKQAAIAAAEMAHAEGESRAANPVNSRYGGRGVVENEAGEVVARRVKVEMRDGPQWPAWIVPHATWDRQVGSKVFNGWVASEAVDTFWAAMP
jgi:hypothetical protein